MNKRNYFVSNENGEIACHDCDLGTAQACLEEMERRHPGEGWEVLSDDGNESIRYATIDARKDGRGDEFTSEYDSEQAAVDAAERDWNHLMPSEQAVRTICAVKSVAADDGEFDWGAYDVVKEFKA